VGMGSRGQIKAKGTKSVEQALHQALELFRIK
jgi:hypothetical protein